MDVNLLVFGRPTPPPSAVILKAGTLTLELAPKSGAIRYVELPDGTEAVRAVYPTFRNADWSTEDGHVVDLKVDARPDAFEVTFRLEYPHGYVASVRVTGGAEGVVYAYEGVAPEGFETNRVGLCVLHPIALADSPVEIRHPNGTRTSGRFPDLVQPDWPFRDVVGIATKLPGFKVETAMEGEVFEMEDQRNFGDASYKTYCYPQSRPYPYRIEAGAKVAQTVRITTKPWGSPAESLPPLPDAEAGLIFIEETLPVPLIGLVAGADPTPNFVRAAPVDYLQMPALDAMDLGVPLDLALDLSEDADARVEAALERIKALPEPPDRILVSPPSAVKGIAALRLALGESVLVLAHGSDLGDLNRSSLTPGDADGLAFGYGPQSHLEDDQTLFENVEVLPDLAATAAERTEGPILAGSVRLKQGETDPRSGSLLGAAWLVATLSALVRSDVDAATLFDLEGPDGLFREEGPIPAYHVLMDLHEYADAELVVGVGTARRAAGFALVLDESFRAIVANLTDQPLRLSVVAASDSAHMVKVLDGRNVVQAVEDPIAWRALPGEAIEPLEGAVTVDLGPYGIARIDTEVDDLGESEAT